MIEQTFNYGDIIEYIDSTYDINFENARNWAKLNNADFIELIDRRIEKENKLYRYWEIRQKKSLSPEEEAEILKQQRIKELHESLNNSDYVIIKIAEAQALNKYELVNQLLNEYTDIIQERQNWRKELNELLDNNE